MRHRLGVLPGTALADEFAAVLIRSYHVWEREAVDAVCTPKTRFALRVTVVASGF